MDLATTSPAEAEDEWELCNDDGFIYKRKKRRLDPSAAAAPPPPPPDPLAEERQRRERKRRALLKIKGRYQEELALWEHLSNTCRAMQEKARELQLEREKEKERASSSSSGSADEELDRQRSDFGSAIDKLLLQAEAQEALINDVSNLCDVAEALSSVQEEQLKQSLFDLPVWASPQELMAALCDESAWTRLVHGNLRQFEKFSPRSADQKPGSSEQAELQEAIMCNISNLCDVAEALYDVQEERLEQSVV